MGNDQNDGPDEDRGESSGEAVSDAHLAKAISHLTLALEELDRADVALACGYVDLALAICHDARLKRQGPAS